MGITREHVSRQDGEIYHRVLIRNFSDKMRNWSPGRFVRLRTVYVNRVPLRMKIYPREGFIQNKKKVKKDQNLFIFL